MGDQNNEDFYEESQESSEVTSIQFVLPEDEEARKKHNSKVAKLIIGLSLHSCKL